MKKDDAILGAFLVDAYSLGAHWVYDEAQLNALDFDWDGLNPPAAMWHKGKKAGNFTHYGDHCLWLLESLSRTQSFDINAYARLWQEKMKSYQGYIDGSSKETLEHLDTGKSPREGAVSHDLSICGRIAPLLLVSEDADSFVSASVSFAKMTHNDPLVLEAVHFFASLLWNLLDGKALKTSIENLLPNYSETIVTWVHEGLDSIDEDTYEAIRRFGPACGVDGGFAGAIHLIAKYDTMMDMMRENAQAGGDSSARGMIAGMILAARTDMENKSLLKRVTDYEKINELLF